MNYERYMQLGFKRTDLNCSVEKNRTGYGGYSLEKDINKKMSVIACSGELDKPKLYIKKLNSDTYHMIPIPFEAVDDIFGKPTEKYDFNNVA